MSKNEEFRAHDAPVVARAPRIRIRTTDEMRSLRLKTGLRAGDRPVECADCVECCETHGGGG